MNLFKKSKFISIVLGLIIIFILYSVISNIFIVPNKNTLFSQHPELKQIDTTLTASYPGYNITEYTQTNKSLNTGITTSGLLVYLSSTKDLPNSEDEVSKVSKNICLILHQENKVYNLVKVTFVKDNRILGLLGTTMSRSVTDDCKGYY